MKKALLLLVAICLLFSLCSCRSDDYESALTLMENGNYADAVTSFDKLGNYKDSAELKLKCQGEIDYLTACAAVDNEQYTEAKNILDNINEYRKSAEDDLSDRCNKVISYLDALTMLENGQYRDALQIFESCSGLWNAEENAKLCRPEVKYLDAVDFMEAGDFEKARDIFMSIRGAEQEVTDVTEEVIEAETLRLLEEMERMIKLGAFSEIETDNLYWGLIEELEADPEEYLTEQNSYAWNGMKLKSYVGLHDSEKLLLVCKKEIAYAEAVEKMNAGDYKNAYYRFKFFDDFKESKANAEQCFEKGILPELKEKMNGGGNFFEQVDAILTISEYDKDAAADAAMSLIRSYDAAADDENFEWFGIDVTALVRTAAGKYSEAWETLADRMMSTPRLVQEDEYIGVIGHNSVMNILSESEESIENLFPILAKKGYFKLDMDYKPTGYFNMEFLIDLYFYYEDRGGKGDLLSSVRSIRELVEESYQYLYSRDEVAPRYALMFTGDTDPDFSSGITLPELSGTASGVSRKGTYLIVTRNTYPDNEATNSWHFSDKLTFALHPENIPVSLDQYDYIITVDNTWPGGYNTLYSGDFSLKAYDISSSVKIWTADGKLVRDLGAVKDSTTMAFVSPGTSEYYSEPDYWTIGQKIMEDYFGVYN